MCLLLAAQAWTSAPAQHWRCMHTFFIILLHLRCISGFFCYNGSQRGHSYCHGDLSVCFMLLQLCVKRITLCNFALQSCYWLTTHKLSQAGLQFCVLFCTSCVSCFLFCRLTFFAVEDDSWRVADGVEFLRCVFLYNLSQFKIVLIQRCWQSLYSFI